jgi:hypothetical protein
MDDNLSNIGFNEGENSNHENLSPFFFHLSHHFILEFVWFRNKLTISILSAAFLQGISVGRRRLSADFQLVFRLIEGSIFITFLAILIILIAVAKMTIKDIIICILAVMPTGWGMLQVSNLFFFSCILFMLHLSSIISSKKQNLVLQNSGHAGSRWF